jgi:YkoY family integral membrane protein
MLSIILSVLFICFLEGLLSFDNALVLATLVQPLPKNQQKKALTYGIFSAYAFRFVALFLITHIIHAPWIKYVGGAYLVYLSLSYFLIGSEEDEIPYRTYSFWRTVVAVECMDILFSVDSILAAYGVSNNYWVIVAGGILGITMMRFCAVLFIRLIERFPALQTSAYALVGIIGVKLVMEQLGFDLSSSHSSLAWGVWCSGAAAIFYGFWKEPE